MFCSDGTNVRGDLKEEKAVSHGEEEHFAIEVFEG